MKTTILACFALAFAASTCLAQGRGEHEGGRGDRGGAPGASARGRERGSPRREDRSPSVVNKMRRYRVPSPSRIRTPGGVVRDNRHVAYPRRYSSGARITARPVRTPPRHGAVARDRSFVRGIIGRQRTESKPNHYYWHKTPHGTRYAHYYDGHDHWYGFYHGSQFYWTRYHADRWWWWDPVALRWAYWWSGYWWWQAPDGTAYVYVDNSYYPYDSSGVVVTSPEVVAPPAEVPAADSGNVFDSPDGSREVQIAADSGAYLYSKENGATSYMKYLGPDADKVLFSGGMNGKPLSILVEYKDDTFAMFDQDGASLDAPSAAADAIPGPPPAPAAVPPPPPGSTP
jgi:hypothetical protein